MRFACVLALVLALVALGFVPAPVGADNSTDAQYASALNLAGRQRMLTQKATKEALQLALGINPDATRAELKMTLELFEKTLIGITQGDAEIGLPKAGAAVAAELAKLGPLWIEFHAAVDGVIAGKPEIDKLATTNLPLLAQMETAVKALAAEAKAATGKESGTVVNLAGRQRMLSQKMTKEFYLIALKHDVEAQKAALGTTLGLFERTLKGLAEGDAELGLTAATDAKVKEQLASIGTVWSEFRSILERAAKGEAIPAADLAKAAELNVSVLKASDAAVKLFEAQMAGK